ncbi:uncharacterized protein PV09_04193 [Verruconis gallopava]|uniref:Acyltransferase 3 domain-containing protein n=1 Tax=Verruconis gallopava TaxID=253628 RepID=A0A0D1YWK0_9PEZI|nr:uncharacterized protein PV09_04193 [Verruconis gallopava]KIW05037.1 hypothetical protein PV09_04193 [Verruconis gallopava]
MRGWASFFVYFRHFSSATHPNLLYGYGANRLNMWIVQLPFLRLIVAGPAMVSLFFIVSGYSLSWAPLKALHAREGGGAEAALLRLSSATFRRAARLFLPAVVSSFLIMWCVLFGLYDRGQLAFTVKDMPGYREPQPPLLRTLPWHVQFKDWMRATWAFLNVWAPSKHTYDVHLWTLSVEFRCSIVLFAALVAFVRCRPLVRAVLLFAMVVYCHYSDYWQGWLFFAGSFLAQLKFIQEDGRAAASAASPGAALLPTAGAVAVENHVISLQEKPLPQPQPTLSTAFQRLSWPDVLRVLCFTLGLFLLSAPDYNFSHTAPGYIWLSQTLPPPTWPENWRILHCLGSFFAVYAVSSTNTHLLRWLFSNALSRYLGRISYALYLVHGPVVHMLGFWLVPWFWDLLGARDPATGAIKSMSGKEAGFAAAFLIVTAVVVWAADVFWRCVDARCVQLAKWVEANLAAL